MSKIRQALQRLRSSPDSHSSVRHASERSESCSVSTTTAQGAKNLHSQRRVFSQNPAGEGTTLDKMTKDTFSVDLKVLCREGLQPLDDDIEYVAQQFRRIKRPILKLAFDTETPDSENTNVIMLASALPKSGKTFCSFNLTTSIARERDVGSILVDADVLKPNLTRVLGLDGRIGLIDFLLDSSITIDDILVPTDLYNIAVVPAGRQHEDATELLASSRMKKFFTTLAALYHDRAIIVDTPPLLLTNEAHVLADYMGQIVFVIEAGETPQDAVLEALSSLSKTKPINAILNKTRGVNFGEYGASGYGYYQTPQRSR